MLLYRAQPIPSGCRVRKPLGNDPSIRVIGRWFTDDIDYAQRHLSSLSGPAQIICVEIANEVAKTFRVANTPFTVCGLSPIDYSIDPRRDYVVPRFFAAQAEVIETVAGDEPGQIVDINCSRREEILRIPRAYGDTVLYQEGKTGNLLTLVCEQSGGSVSFSCEAGASIGGAMLSLGDAKRHQTA